MTETLTPVEQATLCGNGRCDVPLFDGFTLCATHTSHLSRDLAAVGDVWANLQVTIRRQDATSSAIGGGQTGSRPCINLDAHDKGETLASILNGWAGALAGGYWRRPVNEAAAFLTEHMRMVVKEDWAGDLAQELAASLHECRRATDRALDVISLGICGFGDCDGTVTAVVGSPDGKCRTCGAIWNVLERQAWMIGQAWHTTGTLRFLAQALREAKHITTPYETLKKWAQRGKLYGRCDIATREHVYTAADVWHSCHEPRLPRVVLTLDSSQLSP